MSSDTITPFISKALTLSAFSFSTLLIKVAEFAGFPDGYVSSILDKTFSSSISKASANSFATSILSVSFLSIYFLKVIKSKSTLNTFAVTANSLLFLSNIRPLLASICISLVHCSSAIAL